MGALAGLLFFTIVLSLTRYPRLAAVFLALCLATVVVVALRGRAPSVWRWLLAAVIVGGGLVVLFSG